MSEEETTDQDEQVEEPVEPEADVGEKHEPQADVCEKQADPEEPAEPAEPPNDLKIVIAIKGKTATIGVSRANADPYIEFMSTDDLDVLTGHVPDVVEAAYQIWQKDTKYPTYVRPGGNPVKRKKPSDPVKTGGKPEPEKEEEQADQPALL